MRRVFSFGGGVQSTAVLCLAAQRVLAYDVFLFADVGEDSENPETVAFVRDHARPFAAKHGIRFEEVRRTKRDGTTETLLGRLGSARRSIDIPVRMANGAPGNRNCTKDFKVLPIAAWSKRHGATEDRPHTLGLGISTDEFHRAKTKLGIPWQVPEYPLLDLRMDRAACLSEARNAGLPDPPKSSCWFCPMRRLADWKLMRQSDLGTFTRVVQLESLLNERRTVLGKDRVFISSRRKPLDEAIALEPSLFDEDGCESGYCMT